jgi:hypothetical protein
MQKHIPKAATKISNCASRVKVCVTLHPRKAAILRRRWSSVRARRRIYVGGTATGLLVGGAARGAVAGIHGGRRQGAARRGSVGAWWRKAAGRCWGNGYGDHCRGRVKGAACTGIHGRRRQGVRRRREVVQRGSAGETLQKISNKEKED